MSQPIRGKGGHLVFPITPKNTNLVEGRWDLASCQVSLNSVQRFQRRSRKCLSQSEARAAILFFPITPKNTNLVEDVEILLPIKFRWIPFSDFRGEVENVSANQRPGRPSCFSDQPEKHKLIRGRWDLASCQVLLNSVQRFQRRRRKCLSQSETRAAILFFRSARKTQTWKRALRSCFLSSFVEFRSVVSEEKSKMWKFTPDGRRTDGRRTDDGRCAMTIAHSSLRLRWAKSFVPMEFQIDTNSII